MTGTFSLVETADTDAGASAFQFSYQVGAGLAGREELNIRIVDTEFEVGDCVTVSGDSEDTFGFGPT